MLSSPFWKRTYGFYQIVFRAEPLVLTPDRSLPRLGCPKPGKTEEFSTLMQSGMVVVTTIVLSISSEIFPKSQLTSQLRNRPYRAGRGDRRGAVLRQAAVALRPFYNRLKGGNTFGARFCCRFLCLCRVLRRCFLAGSALGRLRRVCLRRLRRRLSQ
jgi:hypothetical protein